MTIKEHDFVELNYTGTVVDSEMVFDTTDEAVAKASGMFDGQQKFGPSVVIIGSQHLISGLDKFLVGKGPGKYSVTFGPEEGFGKKRSDMLKLVPRSAFTKEKINPVVGLPVSMDGRQGVIKTASGGRCIVDFNHPLAGKELKYDVEVLRVVDDVKEKLSTLMEIQLPKDQFEVSVDGKNAKITVKREYPEPVQEMTRKLIEKYTDIVKVDFVEQKPTSKAD